MSVPTFSWLQFADMEVIPDFEPFFDSVLARLDEGLRPDAVICTGDFLIGTSDDERLKALSLFWNTFANKLNAALPSEPVYLAIPGNRDLTLSDDPVENHRFRFWPELRERFWGGDPDLWASVRASLKKYEDWLSTTPFRSEPESGPDLIPGDRVVRLPVRGSSDQIGLILMNTNWGRRTPNSKPIYDIRQLYRWLKIPVEWTKFNRLTLLVTHEGDYPLDFQSDLRDIMVRSAIYSHQPPILLGQSLLSAPFKSGAYLGCRIGFRPGEYSVEATQCFPGPDKSWRTRPLSGPTNVPAPAVPRNAGPSEWPALRQLQLTNFRCFETLTLDLKGRWTCLAGVNAAGKSSILQAVALAMLGPKLGLELGGSRLAAMRRGDTGIAVVRATFSDDDESESTVELTIGEGPKVLRSTGGDPGFWSKLMGLPVLAYGATRNLSTSFDSRYDGLSLEVRQQMTLFDPLTQLASAEVLLRERLGSDELLGLFSAAIAGVFGDTLKVRRAEGSVRFEVDGRDDVGAADLPDGFRSTAAWIADLCAAWCRNNPDVESPQPADVQAVVLIDELDLHLHPSLQRELVPRLRLLFPNIQWVVTTHSPLVLANFDRDEIVALDRRVPGGIRFLDRQIKAFTMDEIYEWLMETPPTGAAIEGELERALNGAPSGSLDAVLRTSPQVDEEEARRRVADAQDLLAKLSAE